MRATGWRILLGVALFFTAAVGCSSKDEAVLTEACNLYRGMTREQVRETMGGPTSSISKYDEWHFDSNNKRLLSSDSSDKVAWKVFVRYANDNMVRDVTVLDTSIAQNGLPRNAYLC